MIRSYWFWGTLLCLTLSGIAHHAVAQERNGDWVLLKTENIDRAVAGKAIDLPETLNRFRALRFVLTAGRLEISRAVVSFGNGQQHYEESKIQLKQGEPTKPVAERDEGLIVTSLSLAFGKDREDSTLQIWGQVIAGPAAQSMGPRARGIGATAAKERGFREVGVFFGTTRRQEADRNKGERRLATFSGEEGMGLTLGRAVVTVPFEREVGSIPRPDFNVIVARLALRSEDPKKDFTIAAVDVRDRTDFIADLKKMAGQAKLFPRQAFVFVHGYNVSFEDAIFRTAQITHDIGFDGPPITFSWPSRGGTWDYKHDVDTAKASRDQLHELLALVASETGVESVNVIAHSMGNDPLLEVLSKQGDIRQAGGIAQNLKLKELLLASPDVSRKTFEQLVYKIQGMVRGGVTLYASANDRALMASKKVASGLARAGDVPEREGPLIVAGVETIDVSEANTSFFSVNHSTFADRQHLVEDIRLLLERGKHPPNERFPIYRVAGTYPRIYWRYFGN